MRELIIPPLIINLMMFIVGIILGLNPTYLTVTTPGGLYFELQMSSLIFTVIATCVGVAFAGFRLLGSGLSDSSISIINKCVVYFITWIILSSITFGFLMTIPVPFGSLVYSVLTLLYTFGVYLEISTVGGTGGMSGKSNSGGGDSE